MSIFLIVLLNIVAMIVVFLLLAAMKKWGGMDCDFDGAFWLSLFWPLGIVVVAGLILAPKLESWWMELDKKPGK